MADYRFTIYHRRREEHPGVIETCDGLDMFTGVLTSVIYLWLGSQPTTINFKPVIIPVFETVYHHVYVYFDMQKSEIVPDPQTLAALLVADEDGPSRLRSVDELLDYSIDYEVIE